VGTGQQVMAAMFEQDVTAPCGPGGKHNRGRTGYRHGTGAGSVTLGGRRLPVTRPRVRAAAGAGELRLPSYDLFSCTEILGEMALEKMLAGLSSRRYERPGARRDRGGGGGDGHEQVGGLPQVRRRDRDRAGAADVPPPG
jgi:hypothetical protein